MSSSSEEKMLTLRSKDGEVFNIRESVAVQSLTMKDMLVGCNETNPVLPIYMVDGKTLCTVLEYLNYKHPDNYSSLLDERKKMFESGFVHQRPFEELKKILLAANYLEIQDLLICAAKEIANQMEKMSVEEVRKSFGVENDYTPEEEAQLLNNP